MSRRKPRRQDRTGLRQMTKDQHEDFYMRWRDIMKALSIHGGILVVGADHEPYFKDQLDRLKEDAWWKISVGDDQPVMMFHKAVPYDEMLIWQDGIGLRTIRDVMGNVGLGRYDKLGMASNEQRPWGGET